MEKACIYARISFDNAGDAHGVEAQVKFAKELAKRKGWEIDEIYIDNNISAFSGAHRPQFERLIKDIEDGKIRVIITRSLDRIGRNMSDSIRFINAVKASKCRLELTQSGPMDLLDPSGEMAALISAVFAQNESQTVSLRAKASHKDRIGRGLWRGGRIPFGYRTVGRGAIEIDPVEKKIMQEWSRRVRTGGTLLSALNWTKEHYPGHRAVSTNVSTLRKRLINPVAAGFIVHDGEIAGKGNWEPIFTVEEHNELCAILNDPSRRTNQGQERKWQGSGVYVCGKCGGYMHVRDFKRNRGKQYYTCREGNCVTIGQEALDELVDETIFHYLSAPENRFDVRPPDDERARRVAELSSELNGLTVRKKDLGVLFAQGKIDADTLTAGNEEFQRKIKVVQQQLEALRDEVPLAELVGLEDVKERWDVMSPDKRAAVIKMLLKVTVLPAKGGRHVPVWERCKIEFLG